MRTILLSGLMALGLVSLAAAGDFPQWRGPTRNGAAADGPKLADSFAKTGPAKAWQSEDIPGDQGFGYGCVSVADGNAYVFVNWKYQSPIKTRVVPDPVLNSLGWTDRELPEPLVKAMEEARVNPAREPLTGQPLEAWILKWLDANLAEKKDRDAFGGYVADRIRRGKAALPLDLLGKLGLIRNEEFADSEALNKWLSATNVPEAVAAAVVKGTPTQIDKAWDSLVCLDVATGKTAWKKQFEGVVDGWGASSTPTIADGRVYAIGSNGAIYCCDAKTGDELWIARSRERGFAHSSVLVADGMVIALAGPLVALDAKTGWPIWRQPRVNNRETSPALCRVGDKSIVLCNAGSKDCLSAVDLKTGKLLWEAPGGGRPSVAVAGDIMVVISGTKDVGLAAYRVSAAKAEKLWSEPTLCDCDASPAIYKGHVYAMTKSKTACLDLETGKLAWKEPIGNGNGEPSPVIADGKIYALNGSELLVIGASPEKYTLLSKSPLPICAFTSPAVVDGKLLVRQPKAVGCLDLTTAGAGN